MQAFVFGWQGHSVLRGYRISHLFWTGRLGEALTGFGIKTGPKNEKLNSPKYHEKQVENKVK